jgi:acyl carrier protein
MTPPTAADLSTRENLERWIRTALARALERPETDIALDADFDSLGLPSLEAVTLSGDLEDALGRPVDANVVFDHPSIARLAAALTTERAHA